MLRRILCAALAGALLAAWPAAAQQPAPPVAPAAPAAQAAPTFPTAAEVVELDLVVRDKKGKLVTDLQPGEVEVLEDGVPQKVTSFRSLWVGAGGAPGAAPATASTPAGAGASAPGAADTHLVTLVFGRLSADGRRLAQAGGQEFAKKYMTPQTVVMVVKIDGGIIPIQERTSDPAAVREAVRQATSAVGGGPGRKGGPVGADASFAGQQMGRFEGGAGALDLAQSDSTSFVSALLSVVEAQKGDKGRKTVLVFSEGFTVPSGYEEVFADLQSRANRANVSFYGIDVRGLQIATQLGESGAALAATAAISEQQRASSAGEAATRGQMSQDDMAQASLRADVVETLERLSKSTGGFLVTQTNSFSKPLARIDEDIRGYYEAAYTPSAPPAPGQFRKIEVRVARSDVHVQSRSGYYTSPPGPMGAFASFAEATLPADFDVQSRFYRFGRDADGRRFDCLLKAEAALDKAEFRQDPASGRLSGRIAFAGRVLRGPTDVVDTFGQDVALGGTPAQVEASRAQTLPLARRLKLGPGNYTAEMVVRDTVGNKMNAQRLAFTVPEPEGQLAMSSLVVVGAINPADAKADPTDPLLVQDQRIVPNLGRPVVAAPGATLPIYYTVYLEAGATDSPSATVEVTHDGRVVARGTSPLPPPDATGRIIGLAPIPLQKLTPGAYTVKVTVKRGEHVAEETTTVTVGS